MTLGDLNQCLRITDATRILAKSYIHPKPFPRIPVMPDLEIFLDKFCDTSKTPVCSDTSRQEAMDRVEEPCGGSERAMQNANYYAVIYMLLFKYPMARQVLCSKDPMCDSFCSPFS